MFALTRQDTLALKGIAICAMLCHHLYGFPPEGVGPYSGVLAWFGILGKVCVALFLFCSGYGLSVCYKPLSILDDFKFLTKRLIKFYLNYWVVFFIFVPITIFVFHRSLSDAYGENVNIFKRFLGDIIGIQGYQSYNITWWFNRLIILLYIVFPILYRLICMKPLLFLTVSILLVQINKYIPCNQVDALLWQLPFVLGIVWHLCEGTLTKIHNRKFKLRYIKGMIAVILLCVVVLFRMYPIIPCLNGVQLDGFLSCAIALCVVPILQYNRILANFFSFLGKHSMNIYLIHTFFIAYWCPGLLYSCEWLRGGGNFIILMAVCLLVSISIEFLKEKIRLYECVNIICNKL